MKDSSYIKKFKVSSFRKIPNPYRRQANSDVTSPLPEMYILIADVKEIPDDIPMKTNPREQALDTKIAKGIKASLEDVSSKDFYLLNRGLLISAKDIQFNPSTSEVSITFGDETLYGNVDGGHTYKVILENRDHLYPDTQYVKIEVLTGIEDIFQDLADARNRSLKVTDATIANLRNEFDIIKDGFKGQPYEHDIAYKQNEDSNRINVSDLIAILTMFNIEDYPIDKYSSFPIIAYTSKNSCVNSYLKHYKNCESDQSKNPFFKMKKIMPKIAELYDSLEQSFGDLYKKSSNTEKHPGAVNGIDKIKTNGTTTFLQRPTNYSVAKGFLYPVLGSFRSLVEEGDDGFYHFVKDPVQLLNDSKNGLCALLISETIDQSRSLGRNPNATGKNAALWKILFFETRSAK